MKATNKVAEAASATSATTTLDAAGDAALAALDDETLTAEGRARRIIAKISDMTFTAPGTSEAMAGELRRFAENARGLRLNNDPRGLAEEAAKLHRRAVELSRPQPPPRAPQTVDEAMTAHQRELVSVGWTGIEVEYLAVELVRTREALADFDSLGVTTASGRRLTRLELRDLNAPREAPWREKFFQSLPKIPDEGNQNVGGKEL